MANMTDYENALSVAKEWELPTMVRTETVGKITTEFYEFTDTKKDKDGKEVTKSIQIRDKATVLSLHNIDLFSGMARLSISGFVHSMARISAKVAKSSVNGSVVDLVAKIHKEYSRTTLNMYRRVGLMFSDITSDTYKWRDGIPSDVSVNNLSVVLALASKGKDLEELKPEEIESLYMDFYADYIATGLVNLTYSQSELKKQVKDLKNGIIDGESKEVENSENLGENGENSENSENSAKEIEMTPEREQFEKVTEYMDTLASLSEDFKDNSKIVKSIQAILKELSETRQKLEELIENSENSENGENDAE